jgi:tetratricopeptide (TPR) repeat protein
MLAVVSYLRAFDTALRLRWRWLACALVLFVVALLFHAVAVSLPAVLLILDVYPLGRFAGGRGRWFGSAARSIWYEKTPFFAASLVFVILAVVARRHSVLSVEQKGLFASLAYACCGIWFYLCKTVLPQDLTAVYPAPREIDWLTPPFLLSMVATLVVSVALCLLRRRWPGLLAAWLTYVVILLPNLGIIRFSEQLVADRYSYMSMIGWAVMLAGWFCVLWQTVSRVRLFAVAMLAGALGMFWGLIPLTWEQCKTWRNSETLWTHALTHGAALSATAHYNLALVLYNQGRLDAAAAHNALAIQLDSRDAAAHNSMGVVLERQGKFSAAAALYADALRLRPDYLDAHYNLGTTLSRQGKFEEAADHYFKALQLNPDFADAHHNLGVDLSRQGKLAEAETHYTLALRQNPRRAETHTNLAVILSRQGRFDQAETHYREALRLNPRYSEARKNLDVDRTRQQKLDKPAIR